MTDIDIKAVIKTGMAFERTRIEATAHNIAQANSVSSSAQHTAPLFMAALGGQWVAQDVHLAAYQKSKAVYQPDHVLSDTQGFIYLPAVDLAHEMLTLSSAKRAYEANIKVYNSYKEMSAKALEIGK